LVEQLLMTKDKLFYSIAKGVTAAARILKTQLPVNVYARSRNGAGLRVAKKLQERATEFSRSASH